MGHLSCCCRPFETRPWGPLLQGEVSSSGNPWVGRPSDRHDGSVLGRMVVGPARLSLGENLDQPATGVAWVDDVVDAEALGGAQGADAGARLVDHLPPALLRIGCALVFLTEGDVDR